MKFQVPVALLDKDGKLLYQDGVWESGLDVSVKTTEFGSCICSENHLNFLEKNLSLNWISSELFQRQMAQIQASLDLLLRLSLQPGSKVKDLMEEFLRSFRSVFLLDYVEIFALPDGVTLSSFLNSGIEGQKVNDLSAKLTECLRDGTTLSKQDEYFVIVPIPSSEGFVGAVFVKSMYLPYEKLNKSFEKVLPVFAHLLRESFSRESLEKTRNDSSNLGKYLSKNIVRKISSDGTTGDLGGSNKKVVVLFSDIRSFTKISEGLPASKIVELLNFYFDQMGEIIEAHHGTLDKLVGDLMMVVWNIPHEQPEPELLAVRAALEMQKVAKSKVAPRWLDAGAPSFGIGIGINSGQAVAGNLGSKHFMNYTVIGTVINTAQRLEARAKSGEIWVPEALMKLVHGKVPQPIRKERNVELKGLKDPLTAYVLSSS